MAVTILEFKRRQLGLSQHEVADKIGSKRANYGHLENRRIRVTVAKSRLLARLFDVPEGVLFDDAGYARLADVRLDETVTA
mgnify:FL=1